ncbi:DUF4834 domain-containing protein [Salinimicrobium oceani]|uniref:DUF4834 domain-containing protein n=1 Tax=Salinimicrobium oceani TaxID=2722702 RepID=A0ABX1D4M1_9FLAO|nr:DUF4834 domain-containing protein [Salinimicrobium oceani]NJW54133.1 DUF4834 domain-containing protein [Salinimicrobium oceani]
MQEASLSEVLRVMLIVLLIYFGLKLIFRFFGPLLLRYILRKVGKKFEQRFGQFGAPGEPPRKEGDISIDKKPKKTPKSKKDVGEYIDYEEID